MKKKYRCIVCGRVFPEGQGIIIKYGNTLLAFHKSKCAAKFLKLLLERIPPEEIEDYIKHILRELEEKQKLEEKLRAKKI